MGKASRSTFKATLAAADIFRLRRKGERAEGDSYGDRHVEWVAEVRLDGKEGTNRTQPQELGKCGFALGFWLYRYSPVSSLKWDEWCEDNALVIHAGDLVEFCGSGSKAEEILRGTASGADILSKVKTSYSAPLAEAGDELRMVYGIHPTLLYDIISGACKDVETIVAAEGQMLRCFANARSERGRFCFFELWLCLIEKVVPAGIVSEKCAEVYAKVSEVLEDDGKGVGGDAPRESFDLKCRDALGKVPSKMMEVRAQCKVQLEFARCPKEKWQLHRHSASIELGCIVSLLALGACMHGGNGSQEELVRMFQQHTGFRYVDFAKEKKGL